MAGIQKTQKIENDHADEKISVSGSQIQSASENQQEYQPRKDTTKNVKLGGVGTYDNEKVNHVEGGYQPADYATLPVTPEIKQLFKTIQRYTPVTIDIDTKVKAFIPDYIPAVGEVDAFLKMPRPDGQPQVLGLNTLDQPCLNQSDKAKIDLMMKTNNKQYVDNKTLKIHVIEDAEKNPKQIVQWINSVGDIRKNKQPPSVSYSKNMPDIDSLMQVWPPEVEQILSEINIPNEDIDLPLEDYCRISCNLLDIPIHKDGNNSIIESLHVMFTLYSAFKENQHFQVNQQN